MMPPMSTGKPYQDKINMENFRRQKKDFDDRMNLFSKNFTGTDIYEPFSVSQPVIPILPDPVANDAGIDPRPTIIDYGGGSTSEQGIRQFLDPFLQQVQQENQAEMQEKIEPYVQEVQQITDRTFPNFFGFGTLGGIGTQISSPIDNRRSFSNISQAMGSRSNFASSPYKMS